PPEAKRLAVFERLDAAFSIDRNNDRCLGRAAQTVGTKYRVRLIGREAPRSFRWALAHDENVAGQVPQGLAQIVRPSVVRIRFEHQQTAVELYHPLPQG